MTNKNNTTKYFLYARKSTESEDRQVASINDQIREMQKVAKDRGLEIIDIFQESKSAKSIGRPVFNEMIKQIEKGKANGIICWKADRLARNMKDGGLIIDLLNKGTIKHICAYDSDYKSEDNVIILSVAFGCSTQYSKDLAINVKRGMKSRAERGWYPTNPPLGYKTFRENAKAESVIIKDDNFLLIKKLFKLILNRSCSVPSLCDKAFELGIKTKFNKKLALSHICKILRNPFYYGKFEWPANSGNWYNGAHKPMITYTEYQTIQKIITKIPKSKEGFKKHQMAYKGIFKCKACQGSITASKVKKVQQNGNKHEYIYYHCGKSKDKNCEQRKFALNEKELEKQVLDLLEQITIPDNIYDIAIQELERSKKKTSQEQEEILNKYQKNLEREKAKIDNLIDLRTENEISKEEFARKRKTIEENIENYQNLIANLENSNKQANQAFEQVFKFATNLKDKFENGSPNEKKAIILNLGSNPETIDRKAHFYLDLRLQPFQKYSQGAIREIRQVQTSKNGLYYTKKAPLGAKNTLVCSVIDSFRTFNWAKALPIPDLVIKDARYLCGLIS